MNGNGCEVKALPDGRVRVEVAGEAAEASPELWRHVLYDMATRDQMRAVVSRELVEPVVSSVWWNGDGR